MAQRTNSLLKQSFTIVSSSLLSQASLASSRRKLMGSGEMVLHVRASAALVEDLVLVPSTHPMAHKHM